MENSEKARNSSGGTVTKTAQCGLCKRQLKYHVQPNRITRIVLCEHCGETTPVAPPPPNNLFTRCPYCQKLLTHSVSANIVICPRTTCGKRVDVARGPTQSVTCAVCRNPITYSGKNWMVTCSVCGESTAVGRPPKGKQVVRCQCRALVILDSELTVGKCPRENCGKRLQFSAPSRRDACSARDVSTREVTVLISLQLRSDQCMGRGGFGAVYRGCYGERECAAKLFDLPPQDSHGSRLDIAAVDRAVRPLVALTHPSLVKYYGVSRDSASSLPVLAMELMKESLTHFLERIQEATPLHVQLDFSHDVALALSYLHEKTIVHGNLSGGNVLLTPDGQVKVSDFGMLSLFPRATVQQRGPNTIPYMPPEAFSVPPFRTEKLDSFSLGVLALQIITRQRPSPGPRVQAVTDPRFPSRPQQLPVSEGTRRKAHMDLVNYANPLLSVVVLCLDDIGERRPSMAEISNLISLSKVSDDYRASQQQAGIDWSLRHTAQHCYDPVHTADPTLNSTATSTDVHSKQDGTFLSVAQPTAPSAPPQPVVLSGAQPTAPSAPPQPVVLSGAQPTAPSAPPQPVVLSGAQPTAPSAPPQPVVLSGAQPIAPSAPPQPVLSEKEEAEVRLNQLSLQKEDQGVGREGTEGGKAWWRQGWREIGWGSIKKRWERKGKEEEVGDQEGAEGKTDEGVVEGEGDKEGAVVVGEREAKEKEVAVSEGLTDISTEPSAPPLLVEEVSLPPYSAVPPPQQTYPSPQGQFAQHAPGTAVPIEQQAPPPYTQLLPQHAQQTPPPAPQSSAGPPGGGGGGGGESARGMPEGTYNFQCGVCKRKSKYRVPPGKRFIVVRCTSCKEHTPVAPPAAGKVFDRCTFCNCCITYPATAKKSICARPTCKKVLFYHTTTGRLVKRRPCEVCHYEMEYCDDPGTNISVLICSQCGESNCIKSAPPGKHYTRCPFCNVLINHDYSAARVVCPRSTCQKMVEVGDGEKLSVQCQVCQQTIVFYGSRREVLCGHCGKCTAVGVPPPWKAYVRCSCQALLTYDMGLTRVRCPMKNCGKVMRIGRDGARTEATGSSTSLLGAIAKTFF